MRYMAIYRATNPREATARFARWSPPKGYVIKDHYFSPDGRGFAVVEADTPDALVAAMAAFVDVMDLEFTPIAPIEAAMAATLGSFAWVDSLAGED